MSTLTFTIIQTDLKWEDKQANIRMLEQKIKSIDKKTEVVILPEMFTTAFSMNTQLAESMGGETIMWMKKIAAEKNIVLTGSIIINENSNYYNRLVWVLPDGETGKYDKRHLFAYANENEHYTPGNKRLIASVKGWKINLMICYDLRFPVWSRQTRKTVNEETGPEYDVLIYVANWPERRSNAWKTLLQARAIENQCYCIGVNRVGIDGKDNNYAGDSMVISPLGDILYHKPYAEDIHTITLEKSVLENVREKMPFWKDGDEFVII